MAKFIAAAALYVIALVLISIGVDMAPATGWPINDVQLNGCAALVVGMIAKTAGHIVMMNIR